MRLRMGAGFHDRVFLPPLRKLHGERRSYVEGRDSVRAERVP